MSLYDRQETLLLNSDQSICIIGCGGIGYWVAKIAAMSGIDEIHLFDPDTIEEHNLNRLDLPLSVIGKNKAEITRNIIHRLRPNCLVSSYPFIFQVHMYPNTDWIVDCTDKMGSQKENKDIALKYNCKYIKAGYNGENLSIHNEIAEWGEADDGYTIVPSWAVPAMIVASLTVAKIMKYNNAEIATNIKRIFESGFHV